MNVNDILIRAIQEDYNNGGTANDFLTPVQVAHWIDKAVTEYWGIFQDNEYSYFNVNENTLNMVPYFNIYPIPNGDPAQSDLLGFSAIPTSGNWAINFTQNAVAFTTASLAANATATQIQNAINACVTGGVTAPQCTVTPNWNVANNLGDQTLGFTILWDITTIPIANGGNGPVTYQPFTNTTNATISATPGTANIYAQNIAFITSMAFRTGAAPNFGYTPIASLPPRKQFGNAGSLMGAVLRVTQSGGPSVSWGLSSGSPDGNGYPTLNIRFDSWPTQTATVVYNGLRYPTKVPYLATGQPVTTYVPDLPLHFHEGIVLRVLKMAYLRAKADTSEIETLIEKFDNTQFAVESRSVQRQGPDLIEDIRNWP